MMAKIRVWEPALCCNTGVCGPDVDEALVAFTADLAYLQGQGVDIARQNLANDPMAFATDPVVSQFLKVAGSAGLPLTTVDGVTVMTGTYPDRAALVKFAGSGDGTDQAAAPVQAPAGVSTLQMLQDSPAAAEVDGASAGQTGDAGSCCGGSGCC
jgi:hypothetical protein